MNQNFNPLDYIPQRFGLSYNPPTIIVEYMIPSIEKLYHHKIKCSHFSPIMTIEEIIEEIYKKHQAYLTHQRVDKEQITQLVKKLREKYTLLQSIQTVHYENKQKMHNDSLNNNNNNELKEANKSNHNDNDIINNTVNNKTYVRKYSYDTNEDMNKLTKEELEIKKKEMDILYEENHINIGDKDYQYDIRKDFNYDEYNAEWDEEDDD